MDKIRTTTVTIGAGASLSGAATLPYNYKVAMVLTASTWDAAKLTFQGSLDGTNYYNITNAGTEYEIAAVTAANWIAINPDVLQGARYIKVRSGTSGAPTVQADATIVTLALVEM